MSRAERALRRRNRKAVRDGAGMARVVGLEAASEVLEAVPVFGTCPIEVSEKPAHAAGEEDECASG